MRVATPPKSPSHEPVTISPALYDQSAVAKIWGVAIRSLDEVCGPLNVSPADANARKQKEPPKRYPEYTPSPQGQYIYTSYDFWTSGFFPGSLYLLHERQRRWPSSKGLPYINPLKLGHACEWWTANLHSQAPRTDTHDLGFMIMPWAQLGWELDRDRKCYESIVAAAYSLASRFDETVGAIRSWDTCVTKKYSFTDKKDAFLVIIDSMMSTWLASHVDCG